MADEMEDIGGIQVGVGASHARLPADLAQAEAIFNSFLQKITARMQVPIRATVVTPAVAQTQQAATVASRPARPGAGDFGAGLAVQSRGQAAQQKAAARRGSVLEDPFYARQITAALAQTGDQLDKNNEIVAVGTKATRAHRTAIMEVQQVAAQPTEANIDFGPTLNDAQALLATMREILATTKEMAALPAPRAATTAGAGGRQRRARAATSDEESDEKAVPTNIRYVDQIERQRRSAREATGQGTLEVNRSEQALTRQRQREEAAAERRRQSEASAGSTRAARVAAASAESQRLTDEQTEPRGAVRESATFAPAMTQRRQAEIDQERQAQAGRTRTIAYSGGQQAQAIRSQAREERTLRRALAAAARQDEDSLAQAIPDRDARIQRRTEERIALQRTSITAAGRTARTAFSGISALFGGNQGALIEARARLAAADTKVTEAEKASLPIQRRLASYDEDIANSTDKVRAGLIKKRDAYLSGGRVVTALDNEKKALLGQKDALTDLNKLQSGSSIARNLLAITAGGAAFSLGMTVVATVAREAAKGLNEFFEIQTGFGGTSTRVTSALGAQTLALHGNADAALAAAEAQAGISAASSEALNAQLKLTTQIKAGAQAQQQASELFRAGSGVGNAPSGLFGSYGGVLGTGLFGQKGFSQQVQTDLSAFQQPRGGVDLLKSFSTGLDYASNPDARQAMDRLSIKQGQKTPLQSLTDFTQFLPGGGALKGIADVAAGQANAPKPFQQTTLSQEGNAYLNNLNDAAKRGAVALGETAVASYRVATSQKEVDQATMAAAAAGDQFGVTLAQQQGIVLAFGKDVAGAGKDAAAAGEEYKKAALQAAVGAGIADPAQLGQLALANERQRQIESRASLDAIRSQQAFQLPSQIAAIGRQTAYATEVQQPAQLGLQGLASPLMPVTTGIAPEDQDKVADGIKEAQGLQDQLNAQYEHGREIIENSYKPEVIRQFGAAAGQAFSSALDAVTQTGTKIAQLSADMSNEQAAYQVAQYNFQLQIARRTLGDIGGLIGQNLGAGQSQLGVLERQNLELSRQGQALQFAMSQRQINFQTALAGFQAPGVTPEERQARVKEAQIEAGFAQKQLTIQKQMFGNQVKIVDIGNLRQGRDLVRQIGLLQRGRQVTIDVQINTAKIERAQKLQAAAVAKAGSYLSAVDSATQVAMGNMQQLESAYGGAIRGITTEMLGGFSRYIGAITTGLENMWGGGDEPPPRPAGIGGPGGHGQSTTPTTPGGGGGGGASVPASGEDRWANIDPRTGMPYETHASGGAYNLNRPIRIGANGVAGEAGDESLLILSHPRSAGASGTSGGNTFVVNFNGPIGVRSESDMDEIARKVQQVLGRTAATKGLRTL